MSFTLYVRGTQHDARYVCCLFLFVIQFILYINIFCIYIVTETYSCARVGMVCVGRRDTRILDSVRQAHCVVSMALFGSFL